MSLPSFWLVTCWAAIYVTTIYFYIATLERQLLSIGANYQQVTQGAWVFSILLPCSGIFLPFIGLLLLKTSLPKNLVIMGIISLATGILSIIPNYGVQYIVMVCLLFNRFFFFVILPILLSKLFGPLGSTTVYGAVLFLAGVVNYTNYLWDVISFDYEKAFMTLYLTQNILCSVFSFGMAWFIAKSFQGYDAMRVSRINYATK